jgi:hypothetical protein
VPEREAETEGSASVGRERLTVLDECVVHPRVPEVRLRIRHDVETFEHAVIRSEGRLHRCESSAHEKYGGDGSHCASERAREQVSLNQENNDSFESVKRLRLVGIHLTGSGSVTRSGSRTPCQATTTSHAVVNLARGGASDMSDAESCRGVGAASALAWAKVLS